MDLTCERTLKANNVGQSQYARSMVRRLIPDIQGDLGLQQETILIYSHSKK